MPETRDELIRKVTVAQRKLEDATSRLESFKRKRTELEEDLGRIKEESETIDADFSALGTAVGFATPGGKVDLALRDLMSKVGATKEKLDSKRIKSERDLADIEDKVVRAEIPVIEWGGELERLTARLEAVTAEMPPTLEFAWASPAKFILKKQG